MGATLFLTNTEDQSSDEEEAEFVTEHVYCTLNNYKLKLLPYSK